eukprot:13083497-Alexandrium_andersonii.AAC.1
MLCEIRPRAIVAAHLRAHNLLELHPQVLLKWPDGQLHPIGSPSLQRGSEEARSGAGASGEPPPAPLLARWLVATPAQGAPVSYTHLTLPTICSV